MRKTLTALTLVGMAVLVGCQEDTITGPSAADFEAERARLAKANEKGAGRKATPAAAAQAAPTPQGGQSGQGAFAAVEDDYTYVSEGRRDPFRSFRYNDGDQPSDELVRGPLEQFELGQLAVVAVIWETNRPRALVESPEGNAFIVREGSRIGKNDGRVIHIGDNLVLVKETYVDFAGEQTTKDVELRIRRSQGG